MSELLRPAAFADWLDRFLPELANGHPFSLLEPAIVSDPTDGQIVHLHGLNLYRAYVYQQLTRTLPDATARAWSVHRAGRREVLSCGLCLVSVSSANLSTRRGL